MARIRSSEGTNAGAFTASDWTAFVAIALIWGSSFLFIAYALEGFPPGAITMLRIGLGAVALWLLPAARPAVDQADWPRVAVLSIIWTALPFTLFPLAQQWINSALTGMLNGATPIATGLIAWLLLRRRPGSSQLLGIAVGLGGIILIGLPSMGGDSETLGVVLVLVASASYGLSLNVAVPLLQKYGSPPVMARMLTLAFLWTVPYGLVDIGSIELRWVPVASVLALGLAGTGLAYVVMAKLAASVGSTRASFITYAIPVVALALGVGIRGDAVTTSALIGIALVVAGSILASRPDPH